MNADVTTGPVSAIDVSWPRRPLTPPERHRLAHAGHMGPVQLLWATLTVAIAAAVGFGLGQLSRFSPGEDVAQATTFGTLSFAVLGVVTAVVMAIVHRNITLPFRIDLYFGHVEVVDVTVVRAVDLGSVISPAWLLDIGEGRLLFLCGRWLLDPASFSGEAGAFPRRRLVVARAPVSGAVVGVEQRGESVPPEHYELPDRLFGSVVSRDSELIAATLEQLLLLGGAERRE